jgi:hypothetical protein
MNSSTAFDLETVDGGENPQGAQHAGFEAVSFAWDLDF